jgi:hypothetical protein
VVRLSSTGAAKAGSFVTQSKLGQKGLMKNIASADTSLEKYALELGLAAQILRGSGLHKPTAIIEVVEK